MDDESSLRARVEALERENEALRARAGPPWSSRVWQHVERTLRMGTWTWDVASQQVAWSPALFALLGYDPATPIEEVARVFDERIHPDDLTAYLTGQERALGGDTSQPTQFRFVRPDGRTLHVVLLYTPIPDAQGQVTRYAGSILDVTERAQLEREQVRLGRLEAVGRLAGSVAHDFNNLLTIVSGNAELLRLDGLEGEELEEITAAVQAGASLTRQLLGFTNPPSQANTTQPLDELVQASLPLVERLLPEDIVIGLELGAAGRQVTLDLGQLQSALVNLAVNARDAMPLGGRLEVCTRSDRLVSEGRERAAAALVVVDTGVGMDEATLARIFEPFFTTKGGPSGPPGTGLGLASVQRFVQAAGGEVRTRSTLGEGTRFELVFPAATPSPSSVEEPVWGGVAGSGTGEVLVVEDAEGVRRVLRASLERAGIVSHVFSSVEAALAAWPALADRVRALITDVVMPGRSGYDLAHRLRRDRPDLGVVFVTGYDPEGRRLEGATVLGKPFTLGQLLQALEAVAPVESGTTADPNLDPESPQG